MRGKITEKNLIRISNWKKKAVERNTEIRRLTKKIKSLKRSRDLW